MTTTKVVRYQTRPECAAENERLIRAVFAELAVQQPAGMRYASFRLADGVSFVHVAVYHGEDNPLARSAAFGEFQAGIGDRCAQGPVAADATVIGSYRLLPDGQGAPASDGDSDSADAVAGTAAG